MTTTSPNQRETISSYVCSLLKEEICNVCPLCGEIEGGVDRFQNHHINHDSSVSEYWNLIRICEECHEENEKNKNDGNRDRKLKQMKRDLFRRRIGPTAYDLLSMARKYKITSTLNSIAEPIRELGYVSIVKQNAIKVGSASHPTICDCQLTPEGEVLVRELNITIANR